MVGQSLRCDTPADPHLLLAGTGLDREQVEPGGTIDETTGAWVARAMTYVAALAPVSRSAHRRLASNPSQMIVLREEYSRCPPATVRPGA